MIRYLQLPFTFDASRMQREVEAITTAWVAHFNRQDYEGDWDGLSLLAPGGASENLNTFLKVGDEIAPTPLLLQSPYLQEVLATFPCTLLTARLLRLSRGAHIKTHTDLGLLYEKGEARLHIPIVTHEQVEFILDGDRLDFKEGECWYMNASLPHSVRNPSPVDRIHLVFDCQVNEWLKEQFSPQRALRRSDKDTSAEDAVRSRQIIIELRRSNDPNKMRLADELEAELNAQK